MSRYEKRLEEDLTRIRDRAGSVAERVEEAVANSVRALLTHDVALASKTILGDLPINREIREIDRDCHAFVARHLPSAGHLRFVSSVLRLNVALERVGDYAVTIGRETVQLPGPPSEEERRDVELMADHAKRMLHESIVAYQSGNSELARGTKAMAVQADSLFSRAYSDLLREGETKSSTVVELFALLTVFTTIDRVTDQAKNICEETIFAVTGETKAPKTYSVLFVDERNDFASQLAEAYSRKAFSTSGRYESAGWAPAKAIDATCRAFLEQHGYDITGAKPTQLEPLASNLASHHVIVGLSPGIREHILAVPFRTVLIEWQLDDPRPERLDATFKQLANEVRELMETLRGPDAD